MTGVPDVFQSFAEFGDVAGLEFFHLFAKLLSETLALGGRSEFGARSDLAVCGVEDDLFDDVWLVFGSDWCEGGGPGHGGAGDLDGVEETAGAAGVDVVGGDAGDDVVDGGEDARVVFDAGHGEGGAAGAALAALSGLGDGFARGVVVVAELLVAEAGGTAAAAVGENVAAEETGFVCGFAGRHIGGTPYPG